MLDTVRAVHTPEGVDLHLPTAGPLLRAVAWLIDAAIRFALLSALAAALVYFGEAGSGLMAVILFVVWWIYPLAFEALGGQTPGKRALRLKVVASDGAPLGWQAALVRNLLRVVDMLPIGYATALVCGFCDAWGRRLGDIVAGSVVVHVPPPVAAFPRSAPTAEIAEVVPPVPLLPAEQAALVAFGERVDILTPERQEELANLLEPVTGARDRLGLLRLRVLIDRMLGH